MRLSKKFFLSSGISLWLAAVIFALLPVWPNIYYRLSPRTSETLASTIASTVTEEAFVIDGSQPTPSIFTPPTPTPTLSLPDTDPSLPTENGLIIEKIGVRGEIHEGSDWQTILRQGVWRVPDFATPDSFSDRPIILAAHRWGYLEWSSSFRKLNSFYNLPQLVEGDKIKIVWDQREFEYTVYSTTTGTSITDYSADLILYTCQLWNSPVRYFVYANRSN